MKTEAFRENLELEFVILRFVFVYLRYVQLGFSENFVFVWLHGSDFPVFVFFFCISGFLNSLQNWIRLKISTPWNSR